MDGIIALFLSSVPLLVQHVSRKCSHNTWHPNVELNGTKDEFERSTCLSLLWVMRHGLEQGGSSAVDYEVAVFSVRHGTVCRLVAVPVALFVLCNSSSMECSPSVTNELCHMNLPLPPTAVKFKSALQFL